MRTHACVSLAVVAVVLVGLCACTTYSRRNFPKLKDLDRRYPGAFRSEAQLGVTGCQKSCTNETRCLKRCPARERITAAGEEQHCGRQCGGSPFPRYVPVGTASEFETSQGPSKGRHGRSVEGCSTVCGEETHYRWRCGGSAQPGTDDCEGIGQLVGPPGPCATCLRLWAPVEVTNPAPEGPDILYVVQINWAADEDARYQVLYEGVCADNTSTCTQEYRPINVLTSTPNPVTKPRDLLDYRIGFTEIIMMSHCTPVCTRHV